MPADLAWHLGELKGEDMQMSIGQKAIVGAFIFLGVATVYFGVMILVPGINDDWLFEDLGDTVLDLMALLSMFGPFVAIAGVYTWRRADAEGRSTRNARVMIVAGTIGIAGLAAVMWWTIIGPIIAIAIVAYWAYKIGQWRGGAPRAA